MKLEERKNAFIEKAKDRHMNKYDYSKVEYINNSTKVCIICPIHGEFWMTPHNHVDFLQNCPKCTGRTKINTEEFVKRCVQVHGYKYDYSNVNYINSETPVLISCPIHGEFKQIPSVHWSGSGCPKCSNESKASKRRFTKEQFISLAKNKHGNKYDYSKVKYVNNRTKVCIICPKHGEFWQTPHCHLNYGCRECSIEIVAKKQSYTNEEFVKRATLIHGNKYDYSKTSYIGSKSKVEIICHKHGPFWQNPRSHWSGNGCPKCGAEHLSKELSDSKDEFIQKAKLKHGNTYSYENVNYLNSKTPVCITCPKHGEFWQTPNTHTLGSGCPKCNKRKSQLKFYNKIKKDLNLEFDFDKRLPWLGQQSLDLYNSKYNFAIEYNGIQHYEPIEYFGGQDAFEYRCKLDLLKHNLCKENNCKLWIVKYNFTSEDYNNLIQEILNYINE